MEGGPPRHPEWIEKDQTRERDVRRCEAPGRGVPGHAAEFSRIFIARRTFGGGADVAMRISEVRGTAGHRGVRTRRDEPQSESASAETNGALMTFGMMWILLQAAIGEVDRRSWNRQFADLCNRRSHIRLRRA